MENDLGGSAEPEAPRRHLRPGELEAAIFDLDGVVTQTARVHAAAWKRLFDDYLRVRSAATGEPFVPFDAGADYRRHVDGRPRLDGVVAFLASRGITLPRGDPSDPPDRETVHGLGNRKNVHFREVLAADGVEVFEGTVALIRSLMGQGIRTALVSSSRNAAAVLEAAGLTELFDAVFDGNEAARLGLRGKPSPDVFLAAARRLDARPDRTMVVEDALSGVEAARAGGFSPVVGIASAGRGDDLAEAGADLVVSDLADLAPDTTGEPQHG